MSAKQAAKDWGAILMGMAALAGVGVNYIQAVRSDNATVQEVAEQGAKLEKAYTLLSDAVRRLEADSKDQGKTIVEMREHISEIRGMLRMARSVGGGSIRHLGASRSPASDGDGVSETPAPALDLPRTLEIAPEVVEQRAVELKSKM